jgi:signal transduction histidine kinase
MTLRQKLAIQLVTMLLGLLAVIATGLWGLSAQRSDFSVASTGYRQLRSVYEIAGHAATAKTFLLAGNPDQAAHEIDNAAARLDMFTSEEQPHADASLTTFTRALETEIDQAGTSFRSPGVQRQQLDALDQVLGRVTAFALDLRKSITTHETDAHHRWRQTLTLLLIVSLVVTAVVTTLAFRQYRSVLTPLERLRQVADRFASGQFDQRLDVATLNHSGTEFGQLADDFNRMARELESLYQDLERQVQTKSRELVRSERLASVGYLAAGIAHEINNPLGIITGYAERTIRKLQNLSDPDTDPTVHNLTVICEEAFRCKAITDRLLSLVRPGEEQQKPVELNALIQEVAGLVQGLPAWHRENIRLKIIPHENAIVVRAAAAELKQVLLNLLINASEADARQVMARLQRTENSARIEISDDGHGMTPSTLEHIFEPFFTEKRGTTERPGTGLGLSISHAIIQNHGGRLTASSDGLKRGSRFMIELPLAAPMPVAVVAEQTLT